MMQHLNIVLAEGDFIYWLIVGVVIGVFKLIEFVIKHTSGQNTNATHDHASTSRSEFQSMLSELTRNHDNVVYGIQNVPPRIRVQEPVYSTPKPKGVKKSVPVKKQAPVYGDVAKIDYEPVLDFKLPETDHMIQSMPNLFPQMSITTSQSVYSASPLAQIKTKTDFKRAVLAKEILGPPRAFEPFGSR
ncbi:MAG: hypothetical protein GX811_03685 [Lentisphaerae bacterium]|nr:hypothetical protein [Lentisphaerota bacterium]